MVLLSVQAMDPTGIAEVTSTSPDRGTDPELRTVIRRVAAIERAKVA